MLKQLTIAAALLASLGMYLRQGNNVTLGTIVMDGGSESKEVDTRAIPPGSKLVGQIANKTGRPVDDITFRVVKTGSGTPPTSSGGNTKVTGGGGTSEVTNTDGGDGFSGNVDLSGGGGAPPMQDGDTYEFEIPVADPGTSTVVKVYITPSVKDKVSAIEEHADLMSAFVLSGDTPATTHRISAPFHDRASMYVTNAEARGGEMIAALSGSVTLPGGITLTSVELLDPSNSFATVMGANIQLAGNTFEITGFAAMEPGRTYELITRFSAVPAGGVLVRVMAEL